MTQQAGLRFYIITFPTQACVFFTELGYSALMLDSDFYHVHSFEPNFLFTRPGGTGTYLTGRGLPQ